MLGSPAGLGLLLGCVCSRLVSRRRAQACFRVDVCPQAQYGCGRRPLPEWSEKQVAALQHARHARGHAVRRVRRLCAQRSSRRRPRCAASSSSAFASAIAQLCRCAMHAIGPGVLPFLSCVWGDAALPDLRMVAEATGRRFAAAHGQILNEIDARIAEASARDGSLLAPPHRQGGREECCGKRSGSSGATCGGAEGWQATTLRRRAATTGGWSRRTARGS